ncbi:hypothetical protein [Pleionea litopenaei]|uniref:Uncharacterized protein n=1 Tax=Pleionea litopenaei TaxID=3070815 RepID=A0AA51X6F0_9GAMM|nr:hypothetical protein [Pleionea sp. HL-JVS1]WMS86784.1 hypothetical protein Q9312_16305 [Pleionea sp. HL-JVS1]
MKNKNYNEFIKDILAIKDSCDLSKDYHQLPLYQQLERQVHNFNCHDDTRYSIAYSANVKYWLYGVLLLLILLGIFVVVYTQIEKQLEHYYGEEFAKVCVEHPDAKDCHPIQMMQSQQSDRLDLLKFTLPVAITLIVFFFSNAFFPARRQAVETEKKRTAMLSILEADVNDTLVWYGICPQMLSLFDKEFVGDDCQAHTDWQYKLSSPICSQIIHVLRRYILNFQNQCFEHGSFIDHRPYLVFNGDFTGVELIRDDDFWILNNAVCNRYTAMVSNGESLKSGIQQVEGDSFLDIINKTQDFKRLVMGIFSSIEMYIEQLEKTVECRIAIKNNEKRMPLDPNQVWLGLVAQANQSSLHHEMYELADVIQSMK